MNAVHTPAKLPRRFGATDDHASVAQSARTFLGQRCTRAAMRKIAEGETGHDETLWRGIAELGWPGLALPEAYGGAGLGHLHQALLFDEAGRALLPGPLLTTTLAGMAIEMTGDDAQKARWLPGIASGKTIATFSLQRPSESVFAHVMYGSIAQLLVAPILEPGDRVGFHVVDLAEATTRREEVALDPTRRTTTVTVDRSKLPDDSRLATQDARDTLHALHQQRALAILAAEMAGGMEALMLLTRDYATEREQFGRKIGSFQAVSHPIVNTMIALENTRSLTYAAAAALDAEGLTPGTEIRARMAKAAASEAYVEAGRRAVQLHGGFGFTWDCDVHFWLKRALWSRAALGDARWQREKLGALLGFGGQGEG